MSAAWWVETTALVDEQCAQAGSMWWLFVQARLLPPAARGALYAEPWWPRQVQAAVQLGLGRIVALCQCSTTLYHYH